MALQRKIARARNRALVGSGSSGAGGRAVSEETDLLWEARMATQAPEIDGVTLINDFEGAAPQPGEIRRLRITEAHDYDVVGTLLPPTEAAPVLAGRPACINIARMKCPICKKEVRSATPNSRFAASAAALSTWAIGPRRST